MNDAINFYREALEVYTQAKATSSVGYANTLSNLGKVYYKKCEM